MPKKAAMPDITSNIVTPVLRYAASCIALPSCTMSALVSLPFVASERRAELSVGIADTLGGWVIISLT